MATHEKQSTTFPEAAPSCKTEVKANRPALISAIVEAIWNAKDKLKVVLAEKRPTIDLPTQEVIRLQEITSECPEFQGYITGLIEHLQEIGCDPSEVPTYLQAAVQTLSSLHVLIAESRNPSPSAIRELALRYALDARKPIDKLMHLCWKRVPDGWWVNFYGLKLWLPPYAYLVKAPRAVRILDFALHSPPQTNLLMEEIETDLAGIPTRLDALPDDEGDQSKGDHLPPLAVVAVDPEDIAILQTLKDKSPRLMTGGQVAGHTHIGEKTVFTRLKNLIEKKLVVRPEGKKRGATITEAGIKVLESIPAGK